MLVRQFLEGEAELLSSEELAVVFVLHKSISVNFT